MSGTGDGTGAPGKKDSLRSRLSLPGDDRIISTGQSHIHSRTVSLLRMILPGVALFLIGTVIIWSQWGHIEGVFKIGLALIDPDEAKTLRMVNPRFAGTRRDSRPYLVTADEAVRASREADIVNLSNPKGDITTKSGAWMALIAAKGVYNQKAETLDLDGGVDLFHDRGLHFVSKTAHIDLKSGVANGNDTVTGNGPSIDITGEGFKVLDDGKTIIFTGKSKALLYPRDNRTRKSPPKRQVLK
jgi:lipopolysaccharide export system protein LptC